MEIQKFKYLKNEKNFLDEIKNIFHEMKLWIEMKLWNILYKKLWIDFEGLSFSEK